MNFEGLPDVDEENIRRLSSEEDEKEEARTDEERRSEIRKVAGRNGVLERRVAEIVGVIMGRSIDEEVTKKVLVGWEGLMGQRPGRKADRRR